MKSTLALLSVLAFTAVLSINALPIPAPAPFSDKERSEIDALRLRGVPEVSLYLSSHIIKSDEWVGRCLCSHVYGASKS